MSYQLKKLIIYGMVSALIGATLANITGSGL